MCEKKFDPVICDPPEIDKEYPPSVSPVIFNSNGSKIHGTFFLASGKGPHPVVLLQHGFPGNEFNYDIAHAVRRMGWNVLIFHYRGAWGSDGNFSWLNAIEDSKAAINFLKSSYCSEQFKTDGSKIVLAGYSMGGFIALLNSTKYTEIKNVASISGFNFGLIGDLIKKTPGAKKYTIEKISQNCEILKGAAPEELVDEMINNSGELNLANYIAQLAEKNILLIAASNDNTANIELHHQPLAQLLQSANSSF